MTWGLNSTLLLLPTYLVFIFTKESSKSTGIFDTTSYLRDAESYIEDSWEILSNNIST